MQTTGVTALLSAYAETDAREASYKARMLELLSVPAPFARSTFVPGHFTASAFVLTPDRDELLLILHKKLGLWLQPGGHIDASDETIVDSARREVREETGIGELELLDGGVFDLDVHAIPAFASEPAHEHFDVRFAFVAPSRELASGEEIQAARWVPLSEVEALTSDASVQRAVAKIRARRAA